jgi:glyoxylase-like metal-dependent hydrolase (beta-lactamase superfamily II)
VTTPGLQEAVDELIDTRPGKELLLPVYDNPAYPINDFIYRSGGGSAAYMIVTDAGRVIVNTGMGFEAPHHRKVFDAICPGPTPYIFSTQAHVDHVGGVSTFRGPETQYVTQADNPGCQADDARIQQLRMSTAMIWFSHNVGIIRRLLSENPGMRISQDTPTPDVTFTDRLALTVGRLQIELISAPGGETTDSMIVWLPEHRIALVSNLLGPLFPHFPNLNTLRGDKYRKVEPYLASVRTLQSLQPELLIVGRHEPIRGAELIDACLTRLHDAVDYVHRETLVGMNAGRSVHELMASISLPPELRVGQGYGKVSWAVRTIWESYVGWFTLRSTTEMYPDRRVDALAALTGALGTAGALKLARRALADADPVLAIHLAEGVLAGSSGDAEAAAVMVDAHTALLATGGDESFWESGWLRHQRALYELSPGE